MDGNKHKSGGARRAYGILRDELINRSREKGALFFDALVFIVAFLFARTHAAFGAYPFGIALVAVINRRAVVATLGALVGALTLGGIGVVYALVMPVTLLLRLVLSSGEGGVPFSEGYLVRVLSASVGSALVGIYELTLGGFSLSSVLFFASGVLLTVGVALSLYGVFTYKTDIKSILLGRGRLILPRDEEGRVALWLFRGSALVLLFLVGTSLRRYAFFGINLSYVFSSLITLLAAARLGSRYAIAVGFMSGLATSALGGAAYALAGAAVGFLYPVGYAYALVGGAVALAVFSGYADGVIGLLSLFPEYGISSILMLPYFRGNVRVKPRDGEEDAAPDASVHSLILDAERRMFDERDLGIGRLSELSSVTFPTRKECEFAEYRNIIIALASKLDPTPCDENIDALAAKAYKKVKISEEDVRRLLGDGARGLYPEVQRRIAEYEKECYNGRKINSLGYEYGHLARMLRAERERLEADRIYDPELSERTRAAVSELCGAEAEARVFGKRQKRVLIAARGSEEVFTSDGLLSTVSEILGGRLSDIEYFRRGESGLMWATVAPPLSCEVYTAGSPSLRTGVSGDSTISLTCEGVFHTVISDGEGSGERARDLSRFVVDYLRATLSSEPTSPAESLGAVDAVFASQSEECFATADVLSVDLYLGEGRLVKAGAAPSFVVRDGSLFAVRACGTPLGCGGGAERTVVELGDGASVIMFSDGIASAAEEAVWLVEEAARGGCLSALDRAERILALAKEHTGNRDDMTVTVVRVYRNE